MKVYPNPTRSKAFISIPADLKNGNLKITDKMGVIIREEVLSNESDIIPLDLSDQPNGFYTVSLANDLIEESAEFLRLSES